MSTRVKPASAKAKGMWLFWLYGYLLLGAILIFAGGGVFCAAVSQDNAEMAALRMEFLEARPLTAQTVSSGPLVQSSPGENVFLGVETRAWQGLVTLTPDDQPQDLWICPLNQTNDAVHFRFTSQRSCRIEYCREMPNVSGLTTGIIFINECWPQLRLPKELSVTAESGRYGFFLCPSTPPDHMKTVTVYGFGKWTNCAAMVSNPNDFPRMHRKASLQVVNSLNYLWAFPLDLVVTPVTYSFWLCVLFNTRS